MLVALESFVEGSDRLLLRAAGARISAAEVLARVGPTPEACYCLGLGLALRGLVPDAVGWHQRAAAFPDTLGGAAAVEELQHLADVDVMPLEPIMPPLPARPRETALQLIQRGQDLYAQGDFDTAALLLGNAVQLTDGLGEEDDLSLSAEANYGEALRASGRLKQAAAVLTPLVEDMRELLHPDDEDFIATLRNLLACHLDARSFGPGLALADELMECLEEGSEPWLRALVQKAWALSRMEAVQEAWPLYRRALEGLSEILGAEHPDLGPIWHEWGLSAGRAGDTVVASQALRMAQVLAEQNHGLMSVENGRVKLSLGTLYWSMDRLADCKQHWEDAVTILGAVGPEECLPAWQAVLQLYRHEKDMQSCARVLRRLAHHQPEVEAWAEELKGVEKQLGLE